MTSKFECSQTPQFRERVLWKALFQLCSQLPLILVTPCAELPYNLERKWFLSALEGVCVT